MAVKPGSPAPSFRLPGSGSDPIALSDLLAGGPALVVFVKSSCPTCTMAMPVYAKLHDRYGDAVPVVAISQDPILHALQWLEQLGFSGPALDDTSDRFAVSRSYGIETVPTAVLVDGEGAVSQVVEGWDRDRVNELARMLAETTGRPVAPVSIEGDGLPVFKPG